MTEYWRRVLDNQEVSMDFWIGFNSASHQVSIKKFTGPWHWCCKNRLTSQPGKPEFMSLNRWSFIGLWFLYSQTVQKSLFPIFCLKKANLEARPLVAVLTLRTRVCTARFWGQFYFKWVTGNVIFLLYTCFGKTHAIFSTNGNRIFTSDIYVTW